jgi:hypothetical protein
VTGGPPAAATRLHPGSADARILAGSLVAVAGLIHVKATIDHAGQYWLFGVLFGLVACAQIALAVALWRTQVPDDVLLAGAIVTMGVVIVWLASRTAGLPIGPGAGEPEQVGVSDAFATMIEIVVVAVVCRIVRPEGRMGRRLGWLTGGHAVRLGIALASAGLLAAAFGDHMH